MLVASAEFLSFHTHRHRRLSQSSPFLECLFLLPSSDPSSLHRVAAPAQVRQPSAADDASSGWSALLRSGSHASGFEQPRESPLPSPRKWRRRSALKPPFPPSARKLIKDSKNNGQQLRRSLKRKTFGHGSVSKLNRRLERFRGLP